MEKIKRIYSECGKRIFEVVKDSEGCYLLHEFVRKYDPEEEIEYEIRVLSSLSGRYGDIEIAVKEAKFLLSL